MDYEKKKVLVIDDNTDICDLVERTLKGVEFEVFKASSGKEGITIAKEQKPDVILLDIMMPEIDGFITSSFIKKIPDTENIPIVFLTARKTTKGLTLALKAGAEDYITKPFSPKDLLKRLRRVLDAR